MELGRRNWGVKGGTLSPSSPQFRQLYKRETETGIDTAYNYWAAPPNFSDIPTSPLCFLDLQFYFVGQKPGKGITKNVKNWSFLFGKKPKFTCRVSFAIQDLPSTGCWHRQSWFEQVELQSIQDDACWKCHRCVLINKKIY